MCVCVCARVRLSAHTGRKEQMWLFSILFYESFYDVKCNNEQKNSVYKCIYSIYDVCDSYDIQHCKFSALIITVKACCILTGLIIFIYYIYFVF